MPAPGEQRSAVARLVALGASNLTLLLPSLVRCARARAGGPVQVFAAQGFGRSYGMRSKFLVRSLPGIDQCGLWAALAEQPPLPTTGLVMDVGNDVLYDVDVPTILAWVERALVRLRPQVQRLVVGGLPPHLDRVGRLRYGIVRTVIVPGCPVPRVEALRRAEALREGLAALALRHGAELVPMRPEWYGVDPIHVRRRHWRDVAAALLGASAPVATNGAHHARAVRVPSSLRVCWAGPQQRRIFGVERRAAQPSVHLPDGSTIATY